MNKTRQERVDAYYTAKEQIVATMMQIANRIHNPPPAERKMPEQIVAPDITKLKQAHMKLREMGDILGIETKALEIKEWPERLFTLFTPASLSIGTRLNRVAAPIVVRLSQPKCLRIVK